MILIFGGAYQGKLDYAKANYSVDRIWDCRDAADAELVGPDAADAELVGPDLNADVVCGLEEFVMECTRRGVEAADWFRERRDEWQDCILIIQDQSQGIVPTDPVLRAAREMNGRLMIYLASEADQVHRVFCGIGKRIK